MRKLHAAIMTAAVLAPLSLAAQVGPPAGGQRMGPRDRGPGMATMRAVPFAPQVLLNRRDRLGLSDAQVRQLETLNGELRAAREKAAADAKPHQDKIRELWQADQPDADALQAEVRALMAAHQSVGIASAGVMAKAKAVLTPEQRGRVEGWADARRMAARRFDRTPRREGAGPPAAGHRSHPHMRRF